MATKLKPGSPKYRLNYMAGMGVSPYKAKLPLIGGKTVTKKLPAPASALLTPAWAQVLTDRQISSRAEREANQIYERQRSDVLTETTRLRDAADRRRRLLTDAMLGAARENAAMGPSILQGYTAAAQGLGQLGALATGAVGDAVRADIASQTEALARVGQGGPTLDASQQQGVENYLGGYLPASNLAALGANANAGYLGQVAASRLGAVEQPWRDYSSTVADLDDAELAELTKLSNSRPDIAAKVLERLYSERNDRLTLIEKQQQQKLEIAKYKATIAQAQEELRYKYAQAKLKALTAADKLSLDRWYRQQTVKINNAKAQISQQQANTSAGNLELSQDKFTYEQAHPEVKGALTLPAATVKIGNEFRAGIKRAFEKETQRTARDRAYRQLLAQYLPAVLASARTPAERESLRKALAQAILRHLADVPVLAWSTGSDYGVVTPGGGPQKVG